MIYAQLEPLDYVSMTVMNEFREGLKAEINLWRELIKESELSANSPEYRRMKNALQLAEVKLRDYEYTVVRYVNRLPEH